MKTNNTIKGLIIGACIGASFAIAAEIKPETDSEFGQRMQWFNDAQFGLFIHYGVYSVLGGEWQGKATRAYAEWIQANSKIPSDKYYPLAAQFNPEKLDADEWVKTAKEAGMTYMVITTKHHEGFCLWDSDYTEYDLGEATSFDRDILAELKAACDKYGIKFGTYYSIIDWHHPSQRARIASSRPGINDKEAYVDYMKKQLKELIDNYQPAVMWFDGDWVPWWTLEDGADLYNYLRELDPKLVINNRVSKRHEFKKDFGTPEQNTPGGALDHYWEACWTINKTWGYKKADKTWKSKEDLIEKLIDINTKGGNLLLNVGPMPDGTWQQEATDRLKAMGNWISGHEESVYDSEFVEIPTPAWGRVSRKKGSTAQQGELFAFIFDRPESGKLAFEAITPGTMSVKSYQGDPLPARNLEKGVEIDLSSLPQSEGPLVVRIQYRDGLKIHRVTPKKNAPKPKKEKLSIDGR
ncbi:alpha-L-fucosidase [Haloferula sp.]|uniref:alpha-L-fucosidase n=1 Tax=Haloferula sp. TaxID=2497595 RepID=UPI003C770A9D